jgi:DNA-binding ferritin-like protein
MNLIIGELQRLAGAISEGKPSEDKWVEEIDAAAEEVVKLGDAAQRAIDAGDYSKVNQLVTKAEAAKEKLVDICQGNKRMADNAIKAAKNARGGY